MRTSGAVFAGLVVLYTLLPPASPALVWIGLACLTAAPAAALGFALLARSRAARSARSPWLFIALASGSALAGQLLWNVHELILRRPVPFPSPSYFLFIAFHLLLFAGLLTSLKSHSGHRSGEELALDGAVAWSVITLALLRLLFEPLRASAPHLTVAEQFYIAAGQIAVHGPLVAAGVLIVWRDSVLPPRVMTALVGVTFANSAANLMSLARLDPDPGRVGDPFDLAWLIGWGLLVHACAAGAERDASAWVGTRAVDAARRVRSAVLPASTLLFGLLALDLAVRGGGTLPTLIALAVTALLIALRGARALNSADREEGERQELERTRGLVALSHTLAGAARLDGALATVCDWARKLLGAEFAWIELIERQARLRSRGFASGRFVDTERPIEGSVAAWLASGELHQWCTGAGAGEPRGPQGDPLPKRHWVSAAPIRFGERTLGALVIAQPDRALYGSEMELLGALADQTAIVIENARLLEEARASERSRMHAEKLATVGQLVAGVAHEINNPLATISSAADLLADAGDDEDAHSSIRVIQEEARRAARIVRSMLDFVHPDELETRRLNLDELVSACLRLREYEHGVSGITVECELRGLPAVNADPGRLQQVFMNLIVNAEHAMARSERRVLRIRGAVADGAVSVDVEDTGVGIPADHIGRVFDPFFTTKTVGRGTGLGLSVSYGILREMGGDIRVASRPGAGTTFTVTLPMAPAVADVEDRSEPADVMTEDEPGLDVLLIDDEANLRRLLGRYLSRAGHRVELAGDGEEAVRLLDGREFDVIVTDLRMPGLDGRQLFEMLADTRPQLVERIIFMSGDTMAADTRQFLESSGRPSIAKPFALDQFGRLLGMVARSARSSDARVA